MIVANSNFLMHHGVLGMKWGVRRYQRKDGSLTPAGRKHLAKLQGKQKELDYEVKKLEGHDTRAQYAKDRDVLKKNVKHMSNQELADAINRIRQEQTYESLIRPEKANKKNQFIEKGKKTVTDIIWDEGKKVATKTIENKLGLNLEPNVIDTLRSHNYDTSKLSDKQMKAYAQRMKDARTAADAKSGKNVKSGVSAEEVREIFEEMYEEKYK